MFAGSGVDANYITNGFCNSPRADAKAVFLCIVNFFEERFLAQVFACAAAAGRQGADRVQDDLPDHRGVVVEDCFELVVRPCFDEPFAVVDDIVKSRVARADFAGEVDFRAQALADDIGVASEHRDFRRAFKVPAFRDGVRPAREYASAEVLFRLRDQFAAHFFAQGVAHDEKVSAFKPDALAFGLVKIIVGNQKVADVEQRVDGADAAFG